MTAYDRGRSQRYREIDRFDGGVGWLAHPDETAMRASHAVRTDGGVWLFDPLDAPGVDELVDELGDVAGVAVCSAYHARDAAVFARRYDVPVTVPRWLDRVEARVDAPVERVAGSFAGFDVYRLRPLRLWREVVAYRESDGTLYVPDFLSTHSSFTVGDERLAMPTLSRLRPPREPFGALSPERILVGHGRGVFADADEALATAIDGARRRFPRALIGTFPAELRAMVGALG